MQIVQKLKRKVALVNWKLNLTSVGILHVSQMCLDFRAQAGNYLQSEITKLSSFFIYSMYETLSLSREMCSRPYAVYFVAFHLTI